jgi:hypothetical protein
MIMSNDETVTAGSQEDERGRMPCARRFVCENRLSGCRSTVI